MNITTVSVICNAYNHEPYIEQCLKSLVSQKTSFTYEILVHDDASTDNTANIIRKFEKEYPEIVKPIYQTENQYSKGGVAKFQYPRAKGKYIALCEGDDYWTDDLKLQRQVEAMEAHPEVDICAHAAIRVSEDGKKTLLLISPKTENCVIPVEDVICGGGGFVATNSLMYRNNFENSNLNFRKTWRIDYTLQIAGSLRGGMLFLPEVISAYRWLSVGSWTSQQINNRDKRVETFEKKKKILGILDEDTQGKYKETIQQTILKEEFMFYYLNGPYKYAAANKYKNIRRQASILLIIKLYIKVLFPWLLDLKNKKGMDNG